MILTLAQDLENALTEQARLQGTTAELLAIHCLRARFVQVPTMPAEANNHQSLAEFLSPHLGVLASKEATPEGARLSENPGHKFTEVLMRKNGSGNNQVAWP